jgi:hypothetical protein
LHFSCGWPQSQSSYLCLLCSWNYRCAPLEILIETKLFVTIQLWIITELVTKYISTSSAWFSPPFFHLIYILCFLYLVWSEHFFHLFQCTDFSFYSHIFSLAVINVQFFLFFLVGLGFELRTLQSQSRSSTAWTTTPVHFALLFLRWGPLNYFPGLASNCNPPNFSLLNS